MQPGKGISALNLIHKAMLAGQILFAAIAVYMVYSNTQDVSAMKEQDKLFQVIAVVLSAAGFFIGNFLFKKKLGEIRAMNTGVQGKFATYRGACIIQWALLEGPCLFCIVAFYLIGNYSFIALAATLMLLFYMLGPSKNKVIIHLGLTEQEVDEL
jgi:hypothetical protein